MVETPDSNKIGKVQVFDLRGGEVFFKLGADIKKSLYYTVREDLQKEFDVLMKEVEREMEGLKPKEIASFMLAIATDKELGPAAVLIKECLNRAAAVLEEIDDLTYTAQNLEDNFTYKLDKKALIRYGFKSRNEAHV